MTQKIKSPALSAAAGLIDKANPDLNCTQKSDFLLIPLPSGVKDKLLKIASSLGIPVQILVESEITKLVLRNWDRASNRPIGRGFDE